MKPVSLLLLIAGVLSLADGMLRLTYTGRSSPEGSAAWWLDATREHSLPTWFSIGVMAWLGLQCAFTARNFTGRLIGAGFCYLAADDALMLHERLGAVAAPWLSGHGVYAWVILLVPVFALGGLLAACHLWRAQSDRRGRICLLVGMALLACALLLEALEGWSTRSGIRLRGLALVEYCKWIEESCELFGPVMLLAALPRRTKASVSASAPLVRCHVSAR